MTSVREEAARWFARLRDAARDPGRPFVVDGGLARATVLGTRFAVNRGERQVRVSVERGRVRVEDSNGGAPVILDRDQVVEVEAGGHVHRIPAAARDGFAWQRGMLIFDSAPLREIAARLSRYRSQPVKVTGDDGRRLTAVVQIADIEHFLHSLPSIAPVRIEELPGETRIILQYFFSVFPGPTSGIPAARRSMPCMPHYMEGNPDVHPSYFSRRDRAGLCCGRRGRRACRL